jgi:peptidoglycan/LPS O-acetylase OafA/YrhL
VLWSLAAEFWFYILFPLGLLALRRGTLRTRVLNGVGFLLVAAFLTRGLLNLFPVWLCGTALAMVKPPKAGTWVRWLAILLYVPIVFQLAMTTWPWRYFSMNHLLGLLTALFLWILLSDNRRVNDTSWTVRSVRTLAGFSYSLYLVHYPFLYFCAVWLNHGAVWMPTGRTLGFGAGLCMMALLYAYGVASCTEFRNDQVRRWVEARLHWPPLLRRVPVAP